MFEVIFTLNLHVLLVQFEKIFAHLFNSSLVADYFEDVKLKAWICFFNHKRYKRKGKLIIY